VSCSLPTCNPESCHRMTELSARGTNRSCDGVHVESSECGCTIEIIQNRPFTTLTFSEKTKIMERERPKSQLKINTVSKGQKVFTRHLRMQLYETVPWLCGCSQLNKLFCWLCILFSKKNDLDHIRLPQFSQIRKTALKLCCSHPFL
jgi:hypothetical protein